ncbi:MAG: DUF4296 domain-containing protein [Massilibacteroides sp.]|nr:DUF4296 domain-containing protein [Massilibacteroides sp.]MDD3061394.1 DUF4296 domain-containing protein [Massilibacteroides sp.]MDD4115014.1 DUF4296 domain-containing protein [Massilibacteroides sp.]MDD4659485.1 DUF4296 domain-containing protein [Massilibacteroides sp.]
MRNKFGYTAFFFLLFLLTTCSKVPDHILSEKKMQAVITDMHLAESLIASDYNRFNNDSVKKVLYNSVFTKHQITQAEYDSSLIWYGQNLDIYLQVYDRAKIDVEQRIKDLGDVQAKAAPSSNQDSVNIWPRRSSFELFPKALFNGVVFDIVPDVAYSSGSSFVLGMKVWGLTEKQTCFPEIRMSVDQGDTILTTNRKIQQDGYHEVFVKSMPIKRVRRVYGFIRLDNSDSTYFKVYIDSLNLIKYNYGSGPTKVLKKDTIN